MPRIAYLGPERTFTEQATRRLVDPATHELIPATTVAAALELVRLDKVDAAVVPVENSVEGSVPPTLDGLALGSPLVAIAETVLPVRFTVLVRPGTKAADVRTVTSHPHALAQVREWLAANLPNAAELATTSTAAAAVAVAEGTADAAITAPIAAEGSALTALAADIGDVADAVTRFLLVRKPGLVPAPTGNDRTSIVVVTENRPGSLSEVLVELALRGIDLCRIESRPTREKLGIYRFFLDFAGHIAEPRVGEALSALHRTCSDVRFLGSFARADGDSPPPPPGTGTAEFTEAAQWLTQVRAGGQA
ncbi:prephenate dehydratase [Crossiella cryophila]|uniref:Prephenate dehydratase n=1 Tax=Crossiella cryophila TaxID=43355 RepID=A0A7W7C5V7_9PSEU|nr:prephenate dehydratase [Crossiella cryophila]MBB4675089.1 prephenate dehydratase [Crossiella cryophila]